MVKKIRHSLHILNMNMYVIISYIYAGVGGGIFTAIEYFDLGIILFAYMYNSYINISIDKAKMIRQKAKPMLSPLLGP